MRRGCGVAETVVVDGQSFNKRSPFGVWALSMVTFGIYGLVWYYKINDEARRYLRDETINPGVAVLAILFGWLIIVPPFVSMYRTGERILRMQERSGTAATISPVVGLLLSFVFGLHYVYLQEQANRAWTPAAPMVPALPPISQ
jgi:hypothetical protein